VRILLRFIVGPLAAVTLFAGTLGADLVTVKEGRPGKRNRGEESVEFWRRAIERDPTRLYRYHRLAHALREVEQREEAIEVLEGVLATHPIDAETWRELGISQYGKEHYAEAAAFYRRSVWYNPTDKNAWRWLGYTTYHLKQYQEASDAFGVVVQAEPAAYDSNYWLGVSLHSLNRYDEAAKALAKAVEAKPDDFEANYWCGSSLLQIGRFKEAAVKLEKAHALRPSSSQTKTSLCFAYAGSGEFGKASKVYPQIMAVLGAMFGGIYLLGLLVLGWFSFRIGRAKFPPVSLSILWVAFMFEGQIACMFLLGLLPSSAGGSNSLLAILLPAVPVLLAALFAFRRQSWGAPFSWPLKFGGGKGIAIAIALLVLSLVINIGADTLLAHWFHQPQRAAVFLREAVQRNPLLALLAVGVMIPIAEEILFRGMIYGALSRWLRTGWVIVVSALLFALVHLDLIFFLPLFFLGLILGWARSRGDSIGLPILIHTLNNSLAVLALGFAAAP
jgi:membrane protease YdiL (CAAX protease family)/tetratricopeptide (TPR) repeat protein